MREEEKKRSSQKSSFKSFFKKRWAFPAIYIATAAIILTAVLWYQNTNNSATDPKSLDNKATDVQGKKFNDPGIEVNRTMENFTMPVKDVDSAVILRKFYDKNGKSEDQEAALVFYQNQYHQNTGIDIRMGEGETFDVVASLSGTVTKVDEDMLLGNVIEIEHDKGIVTQYQSVKEIVVEVGHEVKQGQVIAKAGESMFDEESGVHVHFEIRKDNVAVNPQDYLQKPLSTLQELEQSDNTESADEKNSTEEKDAVEDKTSDDESEEDKSSDEEKDSGDKEKPNNKTKENTKENKKESSNA
ncbi:peptidoglycan DD-metalloendopeptidase family protein [Bacillus sp. FJAT-49705]|uniref:Peptidoglycan DD-metalloendopeptidase family protein n=1 Tax=Cytobacillus citreus TaxID=2833586 RepID=A0ABS5NSK6_9BACI|nr:M23 family metallopeptidase [Cytobacillus citreus]MBS4190113.1 peptidoglycan DD-metalloendopeptidase family protein [Cytobacillus citreus]